MEIEEGVIDLAALDVHNFKAVIDRFQKPVFKYLFGLGFSSAEVEDLSQSVFLKVYSNKDSFQPSKASLLTWIFTIARNEAINFKRKKRIRTFFGFGNENISQTGQYDELFSGLNNVQVRVQIFRAIQTLDDPFKSTLVLFFYNDLSIKEIADVHNCSEGTVKSRLSRGKTELKKYLSEELLYE